MSARHISYDHRMQWHLSYGYSLFYIGVAQITLMRTVRNVKEQSKSSFYPTTCHRILILSVRNRNKFENPYFVKFLSCGRDIPHPHPPPKSKLVAHTFPPVWLRPCYRHGVPAKIALAHVYSRMRVRLQWPAPQTPGASVSELLLPGSW